MNKTRIALGCLGFVLGGGGGLLVGAGASYAIAALLTPSPETQAYLVVLIVPAIAFVGAVTVGATLAWFATRTGPLLAIAAPGWLVLLATLTLAITWSKVARPAKVSVHNDTATPFEAVSLGSDFRRNTRIGALAPGETSAPVGVDLDRPETFNGLEGRAADDYVRHHLSAEETSGLADGDYRWVVSGAPGALMYRFEPAP
ncbi:MAG: hypothetical protein JNJ54_20270 [Myxococcaceae bacterium]|nr:hypothetical protein [Myxococcaceae bacterium]